MCEVQVAGQHIQQLTVESERKTQFIAELEARLVDRQAQIDGLQVNA